MGSANVKHTVLPGDKFSMVTLRGGALAERARGPEADSPDPCRRYVCRGRERRLEREMALLWADCVLPCTVTG